MIDMAKLERVYNIPLRKEFQKAPKYRRAKKAVITIKAFLVKHMKSDDVKLGNILNMKVWERGIKNPPHHVNIKAIKDEKGVVKAELVGFDYAEPVKAEKKEDKKEEKKEETKVEKAKEKKAETAKKVQKEEIKELKEQPAKVPKAETVKEKVEHQPDMVQKAPKADQKISSGEHKEKSSK